LEIGIWHSNREDRDCRLYVTAQAAAATKHSVKMLQRTLMDCWAGKCLAQGLEEIGDLYSGRHQP